MAATAKHDLRQKFPADSSGEEDIAAIAKQISDHAEAIYQTWKSRGLAPTEILNCHSNATAADKFGSALTPTAATTKIAPTTAELLVQAPSLDNNNLEKLVNNFVSEDKARLAAAASRHNKSPAKSLPSSIQFALQKFERNAPRQAPSSTPSSATSSPVKIAGAPMTVATTQRSGTSVVKPQIQPKSASCIMAASPALQQYVNKPSEIVRPRVSTCTKIPARHDSEIFLETIETTFPPERTPAKIIVQQQKRPTSVISSPSSEREPNSAANASGLTTWPLKNKIGNLNDSKKKSSKTLRRELGQPTSAEDDDPIVRDPSSRNSRVIDEHGSGASCLADEVAREEERLINALKTGAVLADEVDASSAPVARQKPAIKKERPKVDPVKPIILTHINPNLGPAVANNLHPPGVDVKTLSKDDLSSMSIVDYAKVRYRAAQQSPTTHQKLEEPRNTASFNDRRVNQFNTPQLQDQIVSTTRTKFEPGNDNDATGSQDPKQSKDDKEFASSRWGPRVTSQRPRHDQVVPHPELTTQQRQHIRAAAATGTGNNPVRPFLTRGSVAERVLIFEKCPSELLLDKRGPRQPAINTWRTGHEVQSKAQTYAREKAQRKHLPPHTTLQRHVKANRNVHIPRFYYPGGKPIPTSQIDATLSRISTAFQSLPARRASRVQFHSIVKACDCPLYWKVPLFLAAGGDKNGFVDEASFVEFWRELSSIHHDAASKFVRITTRGLRDYILPEDLIPLVQDVVETHPGLTFLKEATEFHSRYVHTVVARIFYCVNRSWSGKITVAELRRGNLLSVISVLEHEEDINQVTAYFSYEHFYVIYCKFWELDRDHDLFIDKLDLTRHNDNALSTRMIERIFSGAVTRGGVRSGAVAQQPDDKMSYTEFVWFLLSEEDKNHPTAIEYWFRCMDLDGDGYLSMYELEYFYEEQLHRMEAIGIETLPFEDCLCQMLDMIHPACPGKISLSDLKKCKMTSIFFDTFFNLEKYLDHEQRDPFASTRDHDADGHELSDWDRFAAEEYELLVAEESGNDQNEQMLYESSMEDLLSPNVDVVTGDEAANGIRVDCGSRDAEVMPRKLTDEIATVIHRHLKSSHYEDSDDSDDYAHSED